MPQPLLFRLGAEVRCTDGECGKVRTLVISPGDDAVTHLVVEQAHDKGPAKVVPLALVDTGSAEGETRLRCTRAEFAGLDSAETTYLPDDEDHWNDSSRWDPAAAWPYYAPSSSQLPGVPGTQGVSGTVAQRPVTVDTIPDQLPGEDEVVPGEAVHATDGDIGHVLGFVVEPGSGRVTSVLLREGHLLGRRTVLIPRSAVAQVGWDGFHLSITKEQVKHLPHADVEHPPAGLQAGLPAQRGLSHLAGGHDGFWAVAEHR